MKQKLDCFSVLKNGLPKGGGVGKKHICIIGAGIAGLVAAKLLKDVGHEVTILEAKHQAGGRIYTYRGFPGDMYAEFGAMRYPKQHRCIQYLINDLYKLKTKPFLMYDKDTFIFIRGALIRREDFVPDNFSFGLDEKEKHKTIDQLLTNAIKPLLDIMSQEDKEKAKMEILDKYDHFSVLNYLKSTGLSRNAISLIGVLRNIESRFHFSLPEWFSHYYEDVFGDLVYIEKGSDTLVNSLLADLFDNVHYGAEVHAIKQDDRRVTVKYRSSFLEKSIKADECIITMPFIVMRQMEVEGLDPNKLFAMRNCYYGKGHKIFMLFSNRWWENKYDITHGLSVTDLSIRNIIYSPAGQHEGSKKGLLIGSYCWEQDSMPYSLLSDSERVHQALEDLMIIHPEAKRTFEYGCSYDWSLDPYAGGIGPLFRPHEMSGVIFDDLVRPAGRLWFANDATDRHHRRWVESSISAAIKNTYAIQMGFRNTLTDNLFDWV